MRQEKDINFFNIEDFQERHYQLGILAIWMSGSYN